MTDKLLFSFAGECHNGPSRGIRMADLFEGARGVYLKCRTCKHKTVLSRK